MDVWMVASTENEIVRPSFISSQFCFIHFQLKPLEKDMNSSSSSYGLNSKVNLALVLRWQPAQKEK